MEEEEEEEEGCIDMSFDEFILDNSMGILEIIMIMDYLCLMCCYN
jgi:hypothetical protein